MLSLEDLFWHVDDFCQGVQIITRLRRNLKNRLMPLGDHLLQ